MTGGPVVVIDGLAKSYGDLAAVRDVSMRLEPGTLTALLGPSGCGKSTTLEIIAGLTASDGGTITIAGRSIDGLPPERRPVALVFQKPLLFPHRSVAQNVGFGLRMRGVSRASTSRQVTEMLGRVRLSGYEDRRVSELSGGQEQRVALARALVLGPAVLLLDEPFSQLDAALRSQMRDLVRELHEATGVTTLFVTHDRAEAVDLADEICLMLEGRVAGRGSPEELFTRPPNLATARFLGATNEIAGQVSGGVFSTGGASWVASDAADGPAVLVVRPEAITVAPSVAEGAATIRAVRFAGTHLAVSVELDDGQSATAHCPVGADLRVGQRVELGFSPDRCTTFAAAARLGPGLTIDGATGPEC